MNVIGYATQGKDENLETVGCEILRRTLLSLMSGNIVVVTKKYGKTIVCLDYINVLVINVTKSDTYSFMNGFSRYNQIRMTKKKGKRNTYITPWGTFCYKLVPSGLKNTGTSYQRAMVPLFHDMMHREVEIYVDDILAKLKNEEDHVQVFRKLFERLHKFQLRLNPA
jgi:hypothetical protein